MRLYTRGGDAGATYNPFLRRRSAKTHPCIEFLGVLDEAEVAVGYAAALLRERGREEEARILERVHDILFHIGFIAYRAEPVKETEQLVREVEETIDAVYEPVNDFVKNYASLEAAAVSLARAAVRRAERRLWGCIEATGDESRGRRLGPLLNRLSDLLFALQVRLS